MTFTNVKNDLNAFASKEKAKMLSRFFKCGKGEYGEGDVFIGVKVPDQRTVAKKYYKDISLSEVEKLVTSKIHEYRLTGLLILTYKFPKLSDNEKKKVVKYQRHLISAVQ